MHTITCVCAHACMYLCVQACIEKHMQNNMCALTAATIATANNMVEYTHICCNKRSGNHYTSITSVATTETLDKWTKVRDG